MMRWHKCLIRVSSAPVLVHIPVPCSLFIRTMVLAYSVWTTENRMTRQKVTITPSPGLMMPLMPCKVQNLLLPWSYVWLLATAYGSPRYWEDCIFLHRGPFWISLYALWSLQCSCLHAMQSGPNFAAPQMGIMLPFLDDIIVFGHDFPAFLANLGKIFSQLAQHGLCLWALKCFFGYEQVHYLGHLVSSSAISPNPDKTTAIQQFPIPTNCTAMYCFLGLAGYYWQ